MTSDVRVFRRVCQYQGPGARPWRERWWGNKALFPFWELDGDSIYRAPLHEVASTTVLPAGPTAVARRVLPGPLGQRGRDADGNPVASASGEPCTLALLILWREYPGTEGIFRSGSSINGKWLWMTSSGRLWGRQANVNSPSSSKDLLITDGWHTLVRVSTGQELRQYVNGPRTKTTAVTAAGSWSI